MCLSRPPLRFRSSEDAEGERGGRGREEAELDDEADGQRRMEQLSRGFAHHRRHPAPPVVVPTGPCACCSCAPEGRRLCSHPRVLAWLWDWETSGCGFMGNAALSYMHSSSTLVCVSLFFFFLFTTIHFKAALKHTPIKKYSITNKKDKYYMPLYYLGS